MMRGILFGFLIIGISLALPPKQYRDYEYNRQTNAFYKLHIEPTRHTQAKDVCMVEGAKLMVPTNNEDISQLHGMLKKFPDIGNFVYVGSDGEEHVSAEENPIIDLSVDESEERALRYNNADCEVVTREGEIESTQCYFRHPFICKVEAKDIYYDEQCDITTKGYKYYENVRSCYKVPTLPMAWTQAYEECRAEGAHLIVLNSATESETIKEFLKDVQAHASARTSYFFFAGIRAARPTDASQRVFKTIFNETLEQAGFNVWSDGEPNNYLDSEYCGTIFSNNGKYNDADCSHEYGFICEKEVSPK